MPVLFFGLLAQAEDYPTGLKPASEEELKLVFDREAPAVERILKKDSLRDDMPPAGKQQPQNSCAAWAAAYTLKSYYEGRLKHWPLKDRDGEPEKEHTFSPSFVYNRTNDAADEGVTFIKTLEFLCETGCPTLSTMPYVPSDYRSQGNSKTEEEAQQHLLQSFYRIDHRNPQNIKRFLIKKNPILIAAKVDRSFKELKGDEIWKDYSGSERDAHAMVVIGYDDDLNAFEVQNSWGRGWGHDGRGWISYPQFQRSVFEAYFAKDAATSNRIDPLIAVGSLWGATTNLGKSPTQPSIDEIRELFPSEDMFAGTPEHKRGIYKVIQLNWDTVQQIAYLPAIKSWGEPKKEQLGNIERFTYTPIFHKAQGAFRGTPKDITMRVDLTRDGLVGGWGYTGGACFRFDDIRAVPNALRRFVTSGASGAAPCGNDDDNESCGSSGQPDVLLRAPSITHDVVAGGLPSMVIRPSGRVCNADGQTLTLAISFFHQSNGGQLRAHPMEHQFRDGRGFVATTASFQISGSDVDLSGDDLVIPYRALNFPASNGRVPHSVEFVIDAFLDGKEIRKSKPSEFMFRW